MSGNVTSCQGAETIGDFPGTSLGNQLTARFPSSRAEIHDIICPAYCFFVVLYHQDGVA
jgi:hypothetical protein